MNKWQEPAGILLLTHLILTSFEEDTMKKIESFKEILFRFAFVDLIILLMLLGNLKF